MFKEYKYIKILLSSVLIVYLVIEWNKGIQNRTILCTDKPSYFNSKEIRVLSPSPVNLSIKKLSGEEIFNNQSNELSNSNFIHGLYVINDQFPLIIKNKQHSPITVVFPFVNNMLFKSLENTQYVNTSDDTLSMISSSSFSSVDYGLFSFMNATSRSYNVISDVDLQERNIWEKSKCLIIYGKTKFYSKLMNENLSEFVMSGGNVLLVTSAYFEYEFSYDVESSTIVKLKDSVGNIMIPRNKIPVYESYGGSAVSGHIMLDKGENIIQIATTNWSNIFNNKEQYLFEHTGEISINCLTKPIYTSEIGKLKLSTSSGSIYFIGSEDVLLDVNLSNEVWFNKLNLILDGLLDEN